MKPSLSDYREFLAGVKNRVLDARIQAGRAINRELVLLYWDIGRGIVEKQRESGWGDTVVEKLAADLRDEFPDMRGFSARSLWEMKRFFLTFSDSDFLQQLVAELEREARAGVSEFLQQVVAEISTDGKTLQFNAQEAPQEVARQLAARIPWGHHVLLLSKVKESSALLFYVQATAQFGWSRNVLLNQIKTGAYARTLTEKKAHNFGTSLPEHLAEQADEILKSRYHLEFVGLKRGMKERELEDRLASRLQQFILELGYGFCFVGRQYRLALGKKEYFVDLLPLLKRDVPHYDIAPTISGSRLGADSHDCGFFCVYRVVQCGIPARDSGLMRGLLFSRRFPQIGPRRSWPLRR